MGVVLGLCDSKLFILYSTWVQFYAKPLELSWLAQISNGISSEKKNKFFTSSFCYLGDSPLLPDNSHFPK